MATGVSTSSSEGMKRRYVDFLTEEGNGQRALARSSLVIGLLSESVTRVLLNPLHRLQTIAQAGIHSSPAIALVKDRREAALLGKRWHSKGLGMNLLLGVGGGGFHRLFQTTFSYSALDGLSAWEQGLGIFFVSFSVHFVTYPLFVLRNIVYNTRDAYSNLSSAKAIIRIAKKQGLSALHKGFGVSLLTSCAFNALLLSTLNTQLLCLAEIDRVFCFSFLAGSVLYPIDTITKVYHCDSMLLRESSIFKSLRSVFNHLWVQGKRGFYRGYGLFAANFWLKALILRSQMPFLYSKSYFISH